MLWEKLRDNLIMVFVIKSNFLDSYNKTDKNNDKKIQEKITVVTPEEVMDLLSKMPELNNNCTKTENKPNLANDVHIRRDAYINEVNFNEQIDEPVSKLEEKIRKFDGYKKKVDDNKSYGFLNTNSISEETYNDLKHPDVVQDKGLSFIDRRKEDTSSQFKEICPRIKHVPDFDFHKMANVWQIVYYRMPNSLSCFKLNIRNVSVEARQRFADFLGNFNDTVTWNRCFLEIQSQGKQLSRRHFLQDTFRKEGLFENVIIDEEIQFSMRKSYVLEKKTVNQWYISNGLLMMRDCDSGDLAVFTKHLIKPSLRDIADTVKEFGVDINELKECEEM